jgi:hypothetical protein
MTLPNFLGEFKAMFDQLIQQNNMVLKMLKLLISKLNNGYIPPDSIMESQRPRSTQGRNPTISTTNKIDILLISETHFTTKSYFKIPHYNMYCTNHPDGIVHAAHSCNSKTDN